MKIFIRTQEKDCLFELKDCIYIDNFGDSYYLMTTYFDNDNKVFNNKSDEIILGKFKKRENAIKVLDDIQRILVSYAPSLGKREEFYKVYQVPKEEEIDK